MGSELLNTLWGRVSDPATLRVIVLVAVGLVFARLATRGAQALAARSSRPNMAPVVRKAVGLGLHALLGLMALEGLGFDLGVLLGAAGILTVAIGFASQTSASNLISGVFLLAEDAFAVGDVLQIGRVTGELVAVDLLSLKLRTFDNRLVRIPNETVIKTELLNLTRYPIRRLDILVHLPFDAELDRVQDALDRECAAEPLLLEEPGPLLQVKELNELGLGVQLSAWVATAHLIEGRARLSAAILRALRATGLAPQTPTRTLRLEGPIQVHPPHEVSS